MITSSSLPMPGEAGPVTRPLAGLRARSGGGRLVGRLTDSRAPVAEHHRPRVSG